MTAAQRADEGWASRGARRRAERAARRALAGPAPPAAEGTGRRGLAAARIHRPPEPRGRGTAARGRALLAGGMAWTDGPDAAGLHRHAWLDDLAALGDAAARSAAQAWVTDWTDRHGDGRGPGWAPAVTGDRLSRWLWHAPFLVAGWDGAQAARFGASAAAQARYLAEAWPAAPAGAPRLRALAGLVLAGLSIEGLEALVDPACAGLAAEAAAAINAEGGLAARNPEALLEIVLLLADTATALADAGRAPLPGHADALSRAAPTLLALRHADGGLARFHGGGAGPEGALDLALGDLGLRARARAGGAMGFQRLSARRTTVIVDAAPPPPSGHASTLAFELTSGRRPVIASRGPGAAFGQSWQRAARATEAHATLILGGLSSARLAARARRGPADPCAPDTAPLADRPLGVTVTREGEGHAGGVVMSHDGYGVSHGFTHVRRLTLSADGRALWGEDALIAMTPAQRSRAAAVLAAAGPGGIPFALHFPLHPDVAPDLAPGESTVQLTLRSGETWQFGAEGPDLGLAITPAVHLDPERPAPRPCWQIIVSGQLRGQAMQIGWTLAKAEDTPVGIRDLDFGEDAAD